MASYNPGTYEGTGRGYGGKLIVNVTVSENKIESVKVTQHKEYRGIAWGLNTTPMERYPKLIVEYQTLNIPTVDGADLTCTAILDATAAALKAAGASKEDIAALKAAPAPEVPARSGRKSRACMTTRTWSTTTSWTSATATASSWTRRKTATWSITSTRRSTGSPPSMRP